MTTIDLLTSVLAANLEMLKGHIADFTDAEMLVRPVPTANHTAWQLGHLVGAETGMINAVAPGAVPMPSPEFTARFTKETSKIDDAKAFPSKAEILDALSKCRTATIAWAKTLSEADLEKPTTERMKTFAPTIGHMLAMMPTHTAMHIGQIQVIRRKLGRPVMF